MNIDSQVSEVMKDLPQLDNLRQTDAAGKSKVASEVDWWHFVDTTLTQAIENYEKITITNFNGEK